MSIPASDNISGKIAALIAEIIEMKKREIVSDAVVRFDKEVRAAVGKVAVEVGNLYCVEHVGGELVIRVKIESIS